MASATDDFNRADNPATLGANWTAASGTWGIFSNEAYCPSSPGVVYYSGVAFTGDHSSQAVAGAFYGVPNIWPAVRVQASGDAYVNDATTLYKRIGGVNTLLLNHGTTFTTGDILKLEANGTTLTVYKNGVSVGSVTDATLSGGAPGMYASTSIVTLNDWAGADLTATTTRFYLASLVGGTAASVSPTYGAGWHATVDADRSLLTTALRGTTMTSKTVNSSTAEATSFCLGRQFVSRPLVSGSLSGTVKGQIRGLAAVGMSPAIRVALCDTAGGNIREVLAIAASDLTTFAAAPLRNIPFQDLAESASIALTTTPIADGDRLIVEVGVRETTSLAFSADLSFGDDSGTDLPEDASETAAYNPWVEFSVVLTERTADLLWLPQTQIAGGRLDAMIPSGMSN